MGIKLFSRCNLHKKRKKNPDFNIKVIVLLKHFSFSFNNSQLTKLSQYKMQNDTYLLILDVLIYSLFILGARE